MGEICVALLLVLACAAGAGLLLVAASLFIAAGLAVLGFVVAWPIVAAALLAVAILGAACFVALIPPYKPLT